LWIASLGIGEETMTDDDELSFADEDAGVPTPQAPRRPWRVMIVDDEPGIHSITRLALAGFVFDGRPLEFISAYSGAEAKTLIARHPDTAIMLLDVVMESESAGLDVVQHVRETLGNRMSRIILRTGQPGQAPERRVILEYDINDYKTKTELTAQKLFTSVVAGLRAYAYLEIIEQNRQGLEQIISASASIFQVQSMERFVRGVLIQLLSLLQLGENAFCCGSRCLIADNRAMSGDLRIVAGTGAYSCRAGQSIEQALPEHIQSYIQEAIARQGNIFADDHIVLLFTYNGGQNSLMYLEGTRELSVFDRDLLDIFCANVAIAFNNIHLAEELERTQKEVVERIGAVAETRSEETGNHVRRVAEYCHLLALASGMSDAEAQMLKEAAPMHDIGKVGIPDSILNKPGRLTPEEFEIMKKHAEIGKELLSGSNSRLLDISAIVAYEHHERYDGKGYPRGLSGEDIHIYGRITAIADVFDALGCPRCYKNAWPIDTVFDYMKEQRGKQFDPGLIDLLFARKEEVLKIRESFKD
jgi:response regulator RpfG family c-di-GMP phosphodiesterase